MKHFPSSIMAILKEAPTPDMEESCESLAICDGEEPVDRRRIHLNCLVGHTVSLATRRVGVPQEDRLSTLEVERVRTGAEAAIRALLSAGQPVSGAGITRIADEYVRRAEEARKVENAHRGEIEFH